MARRYSPTTFDPSALEPIVRLWMLRILVPLNGARGLHRSPIDEADLCGVLGVTFEPQEGMSPEARGRQLRAVLEPVWQQAESTAEDIQSPMPLRVNVVQLAALLGLTDVDSALLEFASVLHGHSLLDDCAEALGGLNSNKTTSVLAAILACPETDVRKALAANGRLVQSGLLSLADGTHSTLRSKLHMLSERFCDAIASPGVEPLSILEGAVAPSNPATLRLDNYPHLAAEIRIARNFLASAMQRRKTGTNVLVYGPPGTGKTELVRALAADLGCELFEVATEDHDGDPIGSASRLRAYRAAQRFLAAKQALILFDEVEDVFDPPNPGPLRHLSGNGSNRKGWINKALEGNPLPTFWVTNSVRSLDPAYVRRFDVVIEAPIPPLSVRQRVVRESCGSLANEATLRHLATSEQLAPAILTRAAGVVEALGPEMEPAERSQALLRMVNQTLQAQGHDTLPQRPAAGLPEGYDPGCVRADTDLVGLAQGICRSEAARMCLYGPPGTGKTAYARWLAEQLDRPLYIRRASDLLSKWLGDSEKNVARAFREAEVDGAVLLIDEVDSFLRSRLEARHSWEASLVNEMLTQMESFSGVFIASTNLMGDLDEAALRRFDMKVRFDYLDAEQARTLFTKACEQLGVAPPDAADLARLNLPSVLTPGDFAAVLRQHRFRAIATTMALADALEAECNIKHPPRRSIGFR